MWKWYLKRAKLSITRPATKDNRKNWNFQNGWDLLEKLTETKRIRIIVDVLENDQWKLGIEEELAFLENASTFMRRERKQKRKEKGMTHWKLSGVRNWSCSRNDERNKQSNTTQRNISISYTWRSIHSSSLRTSRSAVVHHMNIEVMEMIRIEIEIELTESYFCCCFILAKQQLILTPNC